MKFTVEEIAQCTNAKILKSNDLQGEHPISTDTRTIKPGDIYLPLKGETFDGEKFLADAVKSGATGYFTTNVEIIENAQDILKVDNTLNAYLSIANYARRKFNPVTV